MVIQCSLNSRGLYFAPDLYGSTFPASVSNRCQRDWESEMQQGFCPEDAEAPVWTTLCLTGGCSIAALVSSRKIAWRLLLA
jgi:hypothetical protein